MILAQTLHTYKTADNVFVGATVEGQTLVIANTRNEEHASEGKFLNLVTVIPLADAIAIAKAVLALQIQADEDAYIDEMYARYQDRQAMEDDHLEHELRVEATHWLQ